MIIKEVMQGKDVVGWLVEVNEEVLGCDKCGLSLDKISYREGREFYFCEQNNQFLCRKCMIDHRVLKDHTDFNIIEIKITKK